MEKARLNRFIEDKNNEVLNYNNLLAQLQTELEKTQSKVMSHNLFYRRPS